MENMRGLIIIKNTILGHLWLQNEKMDKEINC